MESAISITGQADFVQDREYVLQPFKSGSKQPGYQAGYDALSGLRAGSYLTDKGLLFQVVDRIWVSAQGEIGGLG
ncbi:MAG: hypothetical protein ACOCPN_03740, partial [Desulfonatronovibrionaceae bacterium]